MMPTKREIEMFVGPNYVYFYEERFNKLLIGNVPKFAATWNWPAFFLSPIWFIYRKMYMYGFISLFLLFISSSSLTLPIALASGLAANYLYLLHVRSEIGKIKEIVAEQFEIAFSDSIIASEISKRGGTIFYF